MSEPDLEFQIRLAKKRRRRRLAEATGTAEILSYASYRGHSAWNSVKLKVTEKPRSIPNLWRKWSTSRCSEAHGENIWPNDPEDSLFCESLLGLMQRFERFNYLEVDQPTAATVSCSKKSCKDEKSKGRSSQVRLKPAVGKRANQNPES